MNASLQIPRAIVGDAQAFADTWNEDTDAVNLGIAAPTHDAPVFDASAMEVAMFVLTNVSLGIAANVVYDAVKRVIRTQRQLARSVTVEDDFDVVVTESLADDGTRRYHVRLVPRH